MIQEAYNREHGIVPKTIQKDIPDVIRATFAAEEKETYETKDVRHLSKEERLALIAKLEQEMKEA
ncbi:hypothetical protein ACP3W2_29020, partial [Salmonella enterica]|uniref:hypothetical protein n=1 Tax=Salmonella enterica TaxID=28901 RepID=UPI003CEBD1C6